MKLCSHPFHSFNGSPLAWSQQVRSALAHSITHSDRHPVARPWVSLVSLTAFLGMQWLPGVFVLQEVQAQENRQSAQEQVAGRRAAAIEASREAQSLEARTAQRSRIKASQPTDCKTGDCEVTVKALDLSKPPTEKQLRMAGGMGGALTPIGPADVPVFTEKYDKELKAAGIADGLRSLAPIDTDPGLKVFEKKERLERLKKINLRFGQAMQDWNQHRYRKAAGMLKEHVEDFPDSPWGGEAMLHLGCDAKYNGRFAEAAEIYNDLLGKTSDAKGDKSFEIHQKAKLRWADLNIALGKISDAKSQLKDLVKTDSDWRRRTWAVHWLRMMGLYEKNARTLRACGSQALGFMLASSPDQSEKKAGARIALLQPKRENGFTLAELQILAKRSGIATRGFRGRASDLASLPKPLLIHYDFGQFGGRLPAKMDAAPDALAQVSDLATGNRVQTARKSSKKDAFQLEHRAGHFLVVRAVDQAQKRVALFDPQERRGYTLSFSELDREWSGTGLVRATAKASAKPRTLQASAVQVAKDQKPKTRLAWLSRAAMGQVIGGCCGVARTPGNIGPAGKKGPDCGSPTWSINQVNLNMYLSDTPLWYKSPIGPSVNITMNYNSQDATNQSVAFGNKWAFNYGSYVVEDTAVGGGQVTVFMPNSRQENFIPDPVSGGYKSPLGSFTKLRHPTATRYELVENSGETYIYDIPAGTNSLQPFLLQIRDPWGNALSFGYDAQVRLTTITDALGKITRLEYDPAGHITKATDPFGRFASFSYDEYGNMVEVVDIEGNAFQYTYDRDIFITQVNTAQGAWTFRSEIPGREFTTDGFDETYYVTITDPMQQVTKYGWFGGTTNPDTSFVTTPDKRTTTFHTGVLPDGNGSIIGVDLPNGDKQGNDVNPQNGQPRTVTDPSGAQTSFTYNAQGQIDSITDPRGATTKFLFARNGIDMTGVVDATGKQTGTSTFNSFHQITSFIDIRGDRVAFTYTSWGALASVTYPDNSVTNYHYDENIGSATRGMLLSVDKGSVALASYQYDDQGRVTTQTGADNKSVTYEYNDLDYATKTTLPDGTTSETDYACCGIATAKTARNGKKTYYDYDPLKRLTRVQDAQGNTVNYDYDLSGNLKSLTDSKGAQTSWKYDEIGRVIAKQMPDGSVERYGYDAPNRVLSRMDAQGRVFKSFYDASGNMVRMDRPGAANDVTISYDTLNRAYGMRDALGTTVYGYDSSNRVSSIDGPWANDTLSYSYDNMGRRAWMRIGGGDQTEYHYDELSRMSGVDGISGSFDFNYEGNTSRLSEITLPSAAKTGFSYDALNRMTGVQNRTGTGDLISRYSYGYETAGYEKRSVRTFRDSQVGTEAAQRINYDYDVVGQLLSEVSVEAPTPSLNHSFTYDAMGNRATSQGGSGATLVNTTTSRNPLNQITQMATTRATGAPGTTSLSYDVSGNLKQMRGVQDGTPTGTSAFSYTDQDALEGNVSYNAAGVPQHKTSYVYDGMGRKRITKEYEWNATTEAWVQQSEKRYLLDGMDVVQERDQTNAVKTTYVRAGNIGGLLSKSKRVAGQNDTHLYFHYDGQGNVVQLTNATQATVATYKYDAFGNNSGITGSEAGDNLFRFSTKEFQAGSGLYDYGLRFYSPSLGRFINRDPSGIAGGLNLYAAFNNNPLSNIDAYGLSAATFWSGFKVGAGMALIGAIVFGGFALACPAFGAFLTAYGSLLGAVGVAAAYKQYYDIMKSNLCPDERDYKIGELCGGILAGIGIGAAAKFFGPKTKCFVAGTKVLMADGSSKPIEEVKKGDWVMSRSEDGGPLVKKQVKQTFKNYVTKTLLLTLKNGEKIETTGGHRFFVAKSGWQKAKEFGLGTSIVTRAGPDAQLSQIEEKKHAAPVAVYNFEVEDTHTYFVGDAQIWAHNDTVVLYRGVSSGSPHVGQFELAQQGIARPLNPLGDASPNDHRAGATGNSRFTSWTDDFLTASNKATQNGTVDGVVLDIDYEVGSVAHQFDPISDGLESEFLLDDREIKGAGVRKVTPNDPWGFDCS